MRIKSQYTVVYEQALQLWPAKPAAKERASERRSREGPRKPPTRVSFRVGFLRGFWRLPQIESLLAGQVQKCKPTKDYVTHSSTLLEKNANEGTPKINELKNVVYVTQMIFSICGLQQVITRTLIESRTDCVGKDLRSPWNHGCTTALSPCSADTCIFALRKKGC